MSEDNRASLLGPVRAGFIWFLNNKVDRKLLQRLDLVQVQAIGTGDRRMTRLSENALDPNQTRKYSFVAHPGVLSRRHSQDQAIDFVRSRVSQDPEVRSPALSSYVPGSRVFTNEQDAFDTEPAGAECVEMARHNVRQDSEGSRSALFSYLPGGTAFTDEQDAFDTEPAGAKRVEIVCHNIRQEKTDRLHASGEGGGWQSIRAFCKNIIASITREGQADQKDASGVGDVRQAMRAFCRRITTSITPGGQENRNLPEASLRSVRVELQPGTYHPFWLAGNVMDQLGTFTALLGISLAIFSGGALIGPIGLGLLICVVGRVASAASCATIGYFKRTGQSMPKWARCVATVLPKAIAISGSTLVALATGSTVILMGAAIASLGTALLIVDSALAFLNRRREFRREFRLEPTVQL